MKVIYIDDDIVSLKLLQELAELYNFEVRLCTGAQEFLQSVENDKYDIALIDLNLRFATGDSLRKQVKNLVPELPVFLFTNYSLPNIEDDAYVWHKGKFTNEELAQKILSFKK